MSIKKSKRSRNQILLILLGIMLAFVLTLNAKSFYSTNVLTPNESTSTEKIQKTTSRGLIKQIIYNFVGTTK